MKSFRTYISETSNLAPGELYKYSWRVELFLDKFKNALPLKLTDGKDVLLKYNAEQEAAIRTKTQPNKIVFLGLDGQQYRLSSFAKTSEFGGGGGTGAGSAMTKTTESAQAVYAQARWSTKKSEYNPEDLRSAFVLADVDAGISDILNSLPKDWIESCKIGADKLYSLFGNKNYVFHRGSAWTSRLEKTFKRLNSKEKQFANINKWSPADIYMVSPSGANIKFEEATNILELNNILKAALTSKDIIGVSLKLLKKTAKASYFNFGTDKPSVKFDKYTTGTVNFFGGKDVYLYFTVNGKIQFRTFPETFQGEIKGKMANQGKLSYGPIQNILKNLKVDQLMDIKKLRTDIQKERPELMNKFYELYTAHSTDSSKKSLADFTEAVKEKGSSWIFSKFIGCQLIDIIKKNKIEDHFITACIQYASSSSELSAPYLKLE